MNSAERKVIEFYTPEGEVRPYRPLSARLPEFLAQYGPAKGYAVVTEIQDSLSLKPGLLRLYKCAIQAGQKPQDMGLPSPAVAGQTQVCRATLLDSHGRVVAAATASKQILVYKDLEVLETAARQRLLAALGFGGDVLDADESHDQRDLGLTPTSSSASPAPESADSASALPVGAAGAETAPTLPHEPSKPAANELAQLAMLRRQITHLASTRGMESPSVVSVDEARVALKLLMQT